MVDKRRYRINIHHQVDGRETIIGKTMGNDGTPGYRVLNKYWPTAKCLQQSNCLVVWDHLCFPPILGMVRWLLRFHRGWNLKHPVWCWFWLIMKRILLGEVGRAAGLLGSRNPSYDQSSCVLVRFQKFVAQFMGRLRLGLKGYARESHSNYIYSEISLIWKNPHVDVHIWSHVHI